MFYCAEKFAKNPLLELKLQSPRISVYMFSFKMFLFPQNLFDWGKIEKVSILFENEKSKRYLLLCVTNLFIH